MISEILIPSILNEFSLPNLLEESADYHQNSTEDILEIENF